MLEVLMTGASRLRQSCCSKECDLTPPSVAGGLPCSVAEAMAQATGDTEATRGGMRNQSTITAKS